MNDLVRKLSAKIGLSLFLDWVRDVAAGKRGEKLFDAYWALANRKRWIGLALALIAAGALAAGYTDVAVGIGSASVLLGQIGLLDKAWRTELPEALRTSRAFRFLADNSAVLTATMAGVAGVIATQPESDERAIMWRVFLAVSGVFAHLGLQDAAWAGKGPEVVVPVPLDSPAAPFVVPEVRAAADASARRGVPPASWPGPPAAVVLLALLATGVGAQEPAAPVEGVRFGIVASGQVTVGAAETTVTPGASISVDGPLAFGAGTPARVLVRLQILAQPGETLDLTSVETFRAARLDLGASRAIGRVVVGEQVVTTSVAGTWGFATVRGDTPAPLLRYPRRYGIGVRLEERSSGAGLEALFGRDESAGERGYGQILLSGRAPLAVAKGALVLGGDATLSVGGGDRPREQRDVLRLWVGASLTDIAELVR